MSLPKTIRAVTQNGAGGTEVLELSTLPCPTPQAGQVLIEVAAAGVNRPDIAQRLGKYPVPADANPVLGLEVAGTIIAIGSDVDDYKIGQQVCALVHGGGYATHAIADVGCLLPHPVPLSSEQAAALPEVAMTVEFNMMMRANLAAGEWVLIHGGSSGIGSHAIERAKAAGAKVIVTAGSDEKCAYCLELGADVAINYKTQDFVAEVASATNGTGVDVVLDMVAGSYVARNLECMNADGRYALISMQGGKDVQTSFELVLRRRLSIMGSTMRPLPAHRKAEIAAKVRKDVLPLIAKGLISPHIFARFPLDQVAEAHTTLEAGKHLGKIVLTVKD